MEGGGMAERLNAPVLKTVRVERLSGVRIPLPPPDYPCGFSSLRVQIACVPTMCRLLNLALVDNRRRGGSDVDPLHQSVDPRLPRRRPFPLMFPHDLRAVAQNVGLVLETGSPPQ